jgi:DnaD/phage-associated family protein
VANPQPTDAHLRLSHKILKEIMRRNFTKQQRNIIDLILRLSWGCGKPSALIPKKKNFRFCGVSEKQIAAELTQLNQMRVILMNEKAGIYQIQKDYDQWIVTPVKGFDEVEFDELVSLNISTKTPDLRDKLPDSGSSSPNQGQTPRFFSGGTSPIPGDGSRTNPWRVRLRGGSITKVLYSKKRSLLLQPAHEKINVHTIIEQEIGMLSSMQIGLINDWLDTDKFSPEFILRGLKEAALCNARNLKYVDSCLREWTKRGWTTPEQVDAGKGADKNRRPQQPFKVVSGGVSGQRVNKGSDILRQVTGG